MSSEPSDEAAEELHELHEEKDAQVLEREPKEAELMDDDRSETGKNLEGVEND